MPERVIDYDRGVIIQSHPGSGMDVFMYVDKPGSFLTAHGKDVPENVAREAGFDVDKLGKEKLRLERRAKATAQIDKEFEVDGIETEVTSRGGFKIVAFGYGRHNVKDEDGNNLNAHPLTLEMAEKLLVSFADEAKEPKEKK